MLRVPQHERNNVKDIKSPPFVLSLVEGLREHFQQSARIAIAISWIVNAAEGNSPVS